MNAERPDPTQPHLSNFSRLDTLCDEFERAWVAALDRSENEKVSAEDRPRIEVYLSRAGEESDDAMLRELLEIEVELRRRAGETIDESDYLQRFPEYAGAVQDTLARIREHARLGDYELLEPLGRGGMGVVYRARHTMLNRIVAVKVLSERYAGHPDAVTRFRREMLTIGQLDHPNIVTAHDAGEAGGSLFLVMEYVDGVTFHGLATRENPLPPAAACEVIRQAALGLQHALESGLVHRDIKPGNLMLTRTGVVKILDLGLARFRDDAQLQNLTITDTGRAGTLGTVDYMAPEQWDRPTEVDIRADIYSLGCTLFQMLTGHPPFKDVPLHAKYTAHASAPVPSVCEMTEKKTDQPVSGTRPKSLAETIADATSASTDGGSPVGKSSADISLLCQTLNAILARMLAKDPDDRFATPGELVEAISPLADSSALSTVYERAGVVGSVRMLAADHDYRRDPRAIGRRSSGRSPYGPATGSDADTLRASRVEPGDSSRTIPIDTHQSLARRSLLRMIVILAIGVLLGVGVILIVAGDSLWGPGDGLSPNPLSSSQRAALARRLDPLPGPTGHWWFEETPWLSPAIRRVLMASFMEDRTPVDPSRLSQLSNSFASGDEVESLRALEEIVRHGTLPMGIVNSDERHAVRMLIALRPDRQSEEDFEKGLRDVLQVSVVQAPKTATQWHLRAVLLHQLKDWDGAKAAYEAALSAYEQEGNGAAGDRLAALCAADLGCLEVDRAAHADAIARLEEALGEAGDATLFKLSCLAMKADSQRKGGDLIGAAETLTRAETLLADEGARDRLADHPLAAFVLERRAWLGVDQWNLSSAKDLFSRADTIRRASRDAGDRRSWRWILFDQQGQAMADHFLGNQDKALLAYAELIQKVDTALAGNIVSRQLDAAQRRELIQRLPNLYERLADAQLYGSKANPTGAAESLSLAIEKGTAARLIDVPSKWPHVNRMRYKRCVALARAGQTELAAQYLEQIARPKEKEDLARLELQPGGSHERWYAVDKKLADILVGLDADDPTTRDQAARDLRDLVLQTTTVSRQNLESLLLASETLLEDLSNRPIDLATEQTIADTVNRMIGMTESLRASPDGAVITEHFLARYFDRAKSAVDKALAASPNEDLQRVKTRLEGLREAAQ